MSFHGRRNVSRTKAVSMASSHSKGVTSPFSRGAIATVSTSHTQSHSPLPDVLTKHVVYFLQPELAIQTERIPHF